MCVVFGEAAQEQHINQTEGEKKEEKHLQTPELHPPLAPTDSRTQASPKTVTYQGTRQTGTHGDSSLLWAHVTHL